MTKEMNMEHGAEWYRGAIHVAEDFCEPFALAYYTKQLAAAEAREAAQPSAAEVKKQIIAEYIDMNGSTCDCCQHVMIDVTAAETGAECHCMAGDPEGEGSGCAWGWAETAENRQLALEKAAEVIRAAKAALEKLRQYICTHHITYLDRTPDGDRLRAIRHDAREYVESGKHLEALAAIAAWEAGNGKP